MPIILGRVSDVRLRELAEAARLLPYSYDEVGATRHAMPLGYRVDRYSIVIGGPASFDRAVEGLRRWEAHRGAGARVEPSHAQLDVDQTVVVAVQLAVVTAVAPCRVAYVIDEGDRFGFAYGTLEGHPESGEESFTVSRGDDGVIFEVASFSRPATRIAQLGRPVARRVQTSTTRRYLTGLKSFVDRA